VSSPIAFESPLIVLAIAGVFACAGQVKGVIGFALPTVAIGLLGVFLPPAQAASLVTIPTIATNVWQLAAGPRLGLLLRRHWLLIVGVCIGTWIGVGFLVGAGSQQAAVALGVVLCGYGCFGLTAPSFRVHPRMEPWLSPFVGLATGFLTGTTGVFAIPVVPYLNSLGFERDELVQALALSPLVSAIALSVGLLANGVMVTSLALGSALAVIPAFLGMYAGQLVRQRASPEWFRKVFYVGLAVLGGYLAVRNFGLG
jgi:uncharacterized membrane protein YfcA